MSGSARPSPGAPPPVAPRAGRLGMVRRVLPSPDLGYRIVVTVLVLVGLVVVTLGDELRVQNVDPEFMRNLVERTIAFGGTYYENGIHNKGPLEPFVYHLAARLTTYDGFWYAISAFVAGISLVLAWAAARSARFVGATRELGAAAGVAVFVHFTLSGSGYAGVVYVRNLTVLLLALAWLLTIEERAWATPRRRIAAAAAVGGLSGLAVQTLLTTAFTASVLVLVAVAFVTARTEPLEQLRLFGIGAAAGAVVFLGVFPWYWARGAFDEFWAGWWTHARFMSIGTGRSLGSQLGLGWDRLYEYYQARPLAFLVIAAFVGATMLGWKEGDGRWRAFHAGLLGWWAAAWFELVLSQRYSSHYFSITSVPTALMAATLAGHLGRTVAAARPRLRFAALWPVLAAVLAVYLSGPGHFMDAFRATRDFRGVADHAEDRLRFYDGNSRSVWAVLDLVSEDGDALLAWTGEPRKRLRWHRVPATRFIWKSFLLGDIYLGRSGPQYVLPQAWQWFAEDVEESDPVAFVEVDAEVPADTPLAELVADEFRLVYPGSPVPVWLRNDVATEILGSPGGVPWSGDPTVGADSGWQVDGAVARFADAGIARQDDLLALATDSCLRLDGTIGSETLTQGAVVFRFDDNAGEHERVRIGFEAGQVASGSDVVGYEEIAAEITESGPVPFSLVVGRRAAGLVVNGQLRAAVRLPESVSVHAEPRSETLVLADLAVGPAPTVSGCG